MSDSSLQSQSPPEHVAIIMDGNGRWAKQRGLPRIEGHRRGVENVRKIVEEAGKIGIRTLTLYAFSVENWRRPPEEVDALMKLLERNLRQYGREIAEHDVAVQTIGRTQDLPEEVQEALRDTIEMTKSGTKGTLVLALNYGARQEMLDAVRRYTQAVQNGEEKVDDLDWAQFRQYLYTASWPDPDLLIRTSGENRLSNFLLMQCAYAEMHFAPENWPDFGPEQLRQAVQVYYQRQRRYGLTGEQAIATAEAPIFR